MGIARTAQVQMENAICNIQSDEWRELSRAARIEHDPQKVLELLRQLNKALEDRRKEFLSKFAKRLG